MFECHVRFERIFASKILTWAVAVTFVDCANFVNNLIAFQVYNRIKHGALFRNFF